MLAVGLLSDSTVRDGNWDDGGRNALCVGDSAQFWTVSYSYPALLSDSDGLCSLVEDGWRWAVGLVFCKCYAIADISCCFYLPRRH